jgi:hypothetical protein
MGGSAPPFTGARDERRPGRARLGLGGGTPWRPWPLALPDGPRRVWLPGRRVRVGAGRACGLDRAGLWAATNRAIAAGRN